jgi:23S rRNA pseudouridine1911/1915/1917 synthase
VKERIPDVLAGERVDRVVAMYTDLPRGEVADLVAAGHVSLDGHVVTSKSRRVVEGEELAVELPEAVPSSLAGDPAVAFVVVYEDGDVLVIEKPAGLVVHPGAGNMTGTLVHGLLARYPDLGGIGVGDEDRPGIVHRLDAGTSGLLVVARTAAAYTSLVGQLQARSVERRYLALAAGHLESDRGLIDAPIGRAGAERTKMAISDRGREARTSYEVLDRFSDPTPVTLIECKLETGRTHQIRVHLAAIGHPVVGDGRYGGQRSAIALDRLFLHAHQLAFTHPTSGQVLSFSSVLPGDLEVVRARLR